MKFDLQLVERVARWCTSAREWSRDDHRRKLILLLAAVVLLDAAWLLGLKWLTTRQHDASEPYSVQLVTDGRRLSLQDAKGEIANCIKAIDDKSPQQRWYCKRAVSQFQWVSSGRRDPQYLDEVVRQRAYLTMRSEVDHYIRSLDPEQRMHMHSWEYEEQLLFALSPKGLWLEGAFAAAVIAGTAAYLWWPRKKSVRKVKKRPRP